MSTTGIAYASTLGLLIAASGCGAESESPTSSAPSGTAGSGSPQGSKCPLDNLTQSCSCLRDGEVLAGRQVCDTSFGWLPCECADAPDTIISLDGGVVGPVTDPSNNNGNASFYWERTVPAGGECLPGKYEGAFDGIYNVLPVNGPIGLELGESTTGEYFEVSGGTMGGTALMLFPFAGNTVGTLDCSAGYFDGYIKDGYHSNIGGTQQFPFEGFLRAHYDKFNHALIDGVWSVTEPDITGAFPPPPDVQPGQPLPPKPPRGGVGTWSAALTP